MSEPGHEADQQAPELDEKPKVDGKLTRRPQGRRRRFDLITRSRMENLGAPLEAPGAELAELPGIGIVVMVILAILFLVVVGVLLGGFLLALIELIVLALLAATGSLWAWIRGHPKVAVIDVGDERWQRDHPMIGIAQDQQAVREGTDPATLGYQRIR